MSGSGRRSFAEADERLELAGGRVVVEIVRIGGAEARRTSHAPGWRWSEHSAPEAGVARCPKHHVGVLESGRMRVVPSDGEPFDAGPGDVVVIEPGHDAWTLGDEASVLLELS